ncbi:hypothetical protein B0H17DRAFT_1139937 [Mycena rosella]|uniref:Uncharacterized protein n=1 Tax=Mycena rosella TaxID=1033263 RepID=A0AAD7D6T5_MYCRO|nr:hypothetical protein B0H17DRAFT_1139937 [Mycena rosella]
MTPATFRNGQDMRSWMPSRIREHQVPTTNQRIPACVHGEIAGGMDTRKYNAGTRGSAERAWGWVEWGGYEDDGRVEGYGYVSILASRMGLGDKKGVASRIYAAISRRRGRGAAAEAPIDSPKIAANGGSGRRRAPIANSRRKGLVAESSSARDNEPRDESRMASVGAAAWTVAASNLSVIASLPRTRAHPVRAPKMA